MASREVGVARALAEAGVAVAPLVQGADQPWVLGDHVVTAWRWHDTVGPPSPADLGYLAGLLQGRTTGAHTYDLPRFEPLSAVIDAVSTIPVGDPQGDFVRRRARELASDWAAAAARDPAGIGLVHGDLHGDNVLLTETGPLLTDLELAGIGPCSYDVAPAVVAVTRYGADPADLTAFLAARERSGRGALVAGVVDTAGQGSGDPRTWEGFATCVAVYELWVTAWAVSVRALDPVWGAEASRRVASLRDGDHRRWTLS